MYILILCTCIRNRQVPSIQARATGSVIGTKYNFTFHLKNNIQDKANNYEYNNYICAIIYQYYIYLNIFNEKYSKKDDFSIAIKVLAIAIKIYKMMLGVYR